jgi:hypothetical protein
MQPRHVGGDRVAQRRDAEVVRVERIARVQGLDRGRADELGRDFVGLAEPERQHGRVAQRRVSHLADLRGAQRAHGGAGEGFCDGHRGGRA